MTMDLTWIANLQPEARAFLAACVSQEIGCSALDDYRSYPRQLEFHASGVTHRNRMISAGNQNGKTQAGAAEMAMHLTGLYPDWWPGHRFDHPITAWAACDTAETTRDNVQYKLMGPITDVGTGMIPKRTMRGMSFALSRNVSKAYDYQMVRHVSGGVSTLNFKNYQQHRKAWQGKSVDAIWFDEEPPELIYFEGLARTIATKGITWLTFTPMSGMSNVVREYWGIQDINLSKYHTKMNIRDALHLTEEDVQTEINRWPKWQHRARIWGEPAIGEGLIYERAPEDVEVEPFPIPDHWRVINAIDFGGGGSRSHPTAAVSLAWDADQDIVYVVREFRKVGSLPGAVWMALRHWPKGPWAWPKDGAEEEKSTGNQVIDIYRSEGMPVLPMHAQYKARNMGGSGSMVQGVYSVERGILDIDGRMREEKFFVFNNLSMWKEEMRNYHRKDGKIVKDLDDLMDATRYAIMMLRFARPKDSMPEYRPRTIDWRVGA